MALNRVLNFGRVSLWIEHGRRRFTGADSIEGAEFLAREFIAGLEAWLSAEDRVDEEAEEPPPLTAAQRKAMKRLIKLRFPEALAEQAVRELWKAPL